MNKSIQKIIKTKRATIFCRSFFFIALTFCLVSSAFAQVGGINHYQRKCTLDSLIVPGQVYNSSVYRIPFPDSLYDGGTISIKKLEVNGIKARAQFKLSDYTYTSLMYTVNKKNKEKLTKMMAETSPYYSVDIQKQGRKYRIIFSLKE